jgi:hypothetical protein
LEQIQAKRASTSGKLLASDTFAQSSYVSWTKTLYDNVGRRFALRQYHLILSSGDGSKDVNYNETLYAYDAMNRNNRVVSPDGTITRTVYDWRGNVKQTWIGTNDTGATNASPHPNNQSANNMLIVSETKYGGDAGCSTCMAAKDRPRVAIQYVDANTMRITEFGYDWRGRQTHVHNENDEDGNMTYTVQTYDNMNRVVKSERCLLVPNDSYDGGSNGSASYSDSYSNNYSSGSYSSNSSSSGMYTFCT